MSAPEIRHTVKPAVCDDCGGTGYRRVHGAEDYGVSFESETCDTCEYGQALICADELEDDLRRANGEIKRLQKAVDTMAGTLAITVRWGTGVNLQAANARQVLERLGYTLDRRGWLDSEAGYDPDAAPWKEA